MPVRTLEKVLEIGQQNTFLLRDVIRRQDKFEKKLDEISNSIKNLKEEKMVLDNVKGKGKNKTSDIFYHVYLLLYYFVIIYFQI